MSVKRAEKRANLNAPVLFNQYRIYIISLRAFKRLFKIDKSV